MTLKEQNKILDAKIESNVNQYKVDRLNVEISAFSSGDLNKYNFLTKNALDEARFEFSPLGRAFRARLDKTVPKEGVIKLLKNIRDDIAGDNRPNNDDNRQNNDDNDDNDSDNDNNRPNNDDNDNDNRPNNDDNDNDNDNDDN